MATVLECYVPANRDCTHWVSAQAKNDRHGRDSQHPARDLVWSLKPTYYTHDNQWALWASLLMSIRPVFKWDRHQKWNRVPEKPRPVSFWLKARIDYPWEAALWNMCLTWEPEIKIMMMRIKRMIIIVRALCIGMTHMGRVFSLWPMTGTKATVGHAFTWPDQLFHSFGLCYYDHFNCKHELVGSLTHDFQLLNGKERKKGDTWPSHWELKVCLIFEIQPQHIPTHCLHSLAHKWSGFFLLPGVFVHRGTSAMFINFYKYAFPLIIIIVVVVVLLLLLRLPQCFILIITAIIVKNESWLLNSRTLFAAEIHKLWQWISIHGG